jgi:dTDP-glucose 4,6-dehydratase
VHEVAATVEGKDEVAPALAEHPVAPAAAVELIAPGAAAYLVPSSAAGQLVSCAAARNDVGIVSALEEVQPSATHEPVASALPDQEVLSGVADERVASPSPDDPLDVRTHVVSLTGLAVVRGAVEIDGHRSDPSVVDGDVELEVLELLFEEGEGEDDARTAAQAVGARPAGEKIDPRAALERVVSGLAGEEVGALAARKHVVPVTAANERRARGFERDGVVAVEHPDPDESNRVSHARDLVGRDGRAPGRSCDGRAAIHEPVRVDAPRDRQIVRLAGRGEKGERPSRHRRGPRAGARRRREQDNGTRRHEGAAGDASKGPAHGEASVSRRATDSNSHVRIMRAMSTALVTGGAGFLGSHLCEYLLAKGHRVVCLDNLETASLQNVEHIRDPRFEFVHGDVTEHIEIPGPIDFVFHLASPASPIDYLRLPLHTLKVGSYGTHHALGLAKWKRARFLLASTSEVYGDPQVHPQPETYWGHVNPIGPRGVYDEAKRYAEAMTMAYHRQQGVDTCIARIFNTYGPRMRPHDGRAIPTFLRQALENKPLTVFGDGSQTRSFCYVDDMVRGLYLLATSGEHLPVNLGNPEERSLLELAESVLQATGSQSEIVFEALPIDDPQVRQPDITRARAVLDWEPEVPLEEGLRRTIASLGYPAEVVGA